LLIQRPNNDIKVSILTFLNAGEQIAAPRAKVERVVEIEYKEYIENRRVVLRFAFEGQF